MANDGKVFAGVLIGFLSIGLGAYYGIRLVCAMKLLLEQSFLVQVQYFL